MDFTHLRVALIIVCSGLILSILSILFLYHGWIMGTQKGSIAVPIVLTPTLSPSPQNKKNLVVKVSIPYWDQKNAFESFQRNIANVDHINIFWYFLTEGGEIQKYTDAIEDTSIIEYAHNNNVKVAAVITNLPEYQNSTWDSSRVESMLKSEKKRKEHVEDITSLIKRLNFDGIIIDYEQVDRSVRNEFTTFIQELSLELKKNGKYVSVVLHPKTSSADDRRGNGAFQNWKELSVYADQLQIMAYGEHWDEGERGPIASLPWVEKIVLYAESISIPKEKLFLGIPLYGYDWNLDNDEAAVGITFEQAKTLLQTTNSSISWNDTYKSPTFTYKQASQDHEVWFENAQSVEEKIKLAKEFNLAGITFWRLGEEDPKVWDIVTKY